MNLASHHKEVEFSLLIGESRTIPLPAGDARRWASQKGRIHKGTK